jgi:hypothetical protein
MPLIYPMGLFGSGNALLTFAASPAINATPGTSFSFSGVSIGTASADRVVVVAISLRSGGVTAGAVSCTIGGSTATVLLAGRDAGVNTTDIALVALNVPAGATANIAVNTTVSALRCQIAVWALTGTNGLVTPASSALVVANANPMSASIPTKAGGAVLGYAIDGSVGNTTYTWAGATRDFQLTEANGNSWSGAHANGVLGGNLTVSATFSAAPTESAMVCAAW